MRWVDCAHVRRLVLSVLLSSFCLLALWAVLGARAWAGPVQGPDADLEPEPHLSGPARGAASDVLVHAVDYAVHLPIVRRNYRPFANGGFEDGWRGWDARSGPFSGRGSGLSPNVVIFEGGNRALLGEPGLSNDSIPVGYGTIAQTFTLEKRYLHLQYWVFSYDVAKGSQRYFDTFEVSVNRPPDQISTAERDSRGCANAMLNPEGTLTVSEGGLVFCGGQPGSSGQGTLWDTQGWRDVTLDLSAFRGTNVTLYFTIWSREYESPYYNDRGWFNTWAYVDNVQVSNGA